MENLHEIVLIQTYEEEGGWKGGRTREAAVGSGTSVDFSFL